MDILEKSTARYFGTVQKIIRDGSGAYLYRAERKEIATYYNGKKVAEPRKETIYHAGKYFKIKF